MQVYPELAPRRQSQGRTAAGHEVIGIPGPWPPPPHRQQRSSSGRFGLKDFAGQRARTQRSTAATAQEQRTTVLYEAPHRLLNLLQDLIQICGSDRPVRVARELTKRHEQQIGPTLGAALQHFQEQRPQGECTLVLGGAPDQTKPHLTDAELIIRLQELIQQGSKASEAARQVAEETGHSRRDLYALLHQHSAD